jgi:type II secretory ATPase GspE/PulE/Tfp pilus assembly ATPase PilB-like protein
MPPRPPNPFDARAAVDEMLADAMGRAASDVHVEPVAGGCEVRYREDGVLRTVATHEAADGRSMVTRLMVLAQLLTYRLDVPQEGRLPFTVRASGRTVELRLAVMPTTHGLRAAVRLPAEVDRPLEIETLALPDPVQRGLARFASADAGMLLLTGPAGSGKTTTIYALLRHLARRSEGVSIIALEDPVERDLPGVTQIEVSQFGELTYERAMRSILRQDPQVLMLGEIRDAATASLAVQAALSGHRIVSTLHAATPGGAVSRLLEMGLEPYQVTSALFGIVAQRLLRRTAPGGDYRGRLPVAEIGFMDAAIRAAVLRRADAAQIDALLAAQPSFIPMRRIGMDLVSAGLTDEHEVERVLGAPQS